MSAWILDRLRASLFVALSVGIGLEIARAQHGVAPPPTIGAGQRWREGTALREVAGRFEITGDRVTFTPENGRRPMTVLENLALERVILTLRQTPPSQVWIVYGAVTEYQGGNYLLLERAIMRRYTPRE